MPAPTQNDKDRIDLLQQIEELQTRIAEQNKAAAVAMGDTKQLMEDRIKQEKIILKMANDELDKINDLVDAEQKRNEKSEAYQDFKKQELQSWAKIIPEAKKYISSSNKGAGIAAALQEKILNLRKRQVGLDGESLEKSQAKSEIFEKLKQEQQNELGGILEARDALFGTSEAVKKRRDFEHEISKLSPQERKLAEETYEFNEKLAHIKERIKVLDEGQKSLYEKLPEGLQTMVSEAKEFGKALIEGGLAMAPLILAFALLGAGLKSFLELDEAAADFRKETGIIGENAEHITHQAHELEVAYRGIGVEAKDVFASAEALGKVFSDTIKFSTETLGAMAVLNKNFGVSADSAAELQGVLQNIGGLTENAATNVELQVTEMSKMAGVAPKKVLKDMADSAEITSKYFRGDINLLKQQAIQAARLGTNLQDVAKQAEALLDFENGIEDELTAATFVGGQFNLSQARSLAYQGKILDAHEATLDAIEQTGDFTQQDMFTQQALAKAANMSVEEITKQLNMRKKLSGLGSEEREAAEAAIKAGLDLNDVSEDQIKHKVEEFSKNQEIQSQNEKLLNMFEGMVATIGGALVPLFQTLGPILEIAFTPLKWAAEAIAYMIEGIKKVGVVLIPVLALLNAMWIKERAIAIGNIISNAWKSVGGLPVVGPILAAAAIATGIGYLSKAGDMYSPAKGNGKTQVSTKEGGLFQLSDNDEFIAAPGIGKALAGGGANNSPKSGISISQVASDANSTLTNKLDKLIEATMGNKNVYMDGIKVTAGVAGHVNNSTYNNYGL